MRQRSIGEVLRLAREDRGWNFVDLQKMTRIHAKYLQAIENNDFRAIPDESYVPGYLQTYAEALDLNADVIVNAYEKGTLVAFYSSDEEEEMATELSRSYKVKKKKRTYKPLIYLLLSALAILVFVGYIVHSRMQNQSQSADSTASSYSVVSQPASEQASETPEENQASTPASSTASTGVQLAVTGGGDSIDVAITGATTPAEIKLTATNTTSWISVTNTDLESGVVLSNENTTASTTLPAGATTTYITLGVVKGIALQVAGQSIDLSGLTGQTGYITIHFQ